MKTKGKWIGYGIELLVVIIGVSVAFQLNNWKETKKNKKKEILYLKSLEEDLEIDVQKLTYLIKNFQTRKSYVDKLRPMLFSEPLRNDSIFIYISSNSYNIPFNPRNSTYQSIIASGNLEIIENYKLRMSIIELYSQKYVNQNVYDDMLSNFCDEKFGRYMMENIRHTGPNRIDLEFMSDFKFHNLVFSLGGVISYKLEYEKKVLESAKILKKQIEEEIARLE